MISKRIKHYIILITVFFSFYNITYANLEINEIMYSPQNGANYEWVEIFNNGDNSIDLSKYRFFHGKENSGPLTLRSGSNSTLEPYGYAIIAKNLSAGYSWLDFNGAIWSAGTLSLPDNSIDYNTYIAISDSNKNIIDSITYDTSKGGSKASKTSLSKINGEWTSGLPTPGYVNTISDNEDGDITQEENNAEEGTSKSVSTKEEPTKTITYKISTKIISPKIVTAGVPFVVDHQTFGTQKEKVILGRFVWNFGDGMIKEGKTSDPFYYIYKYPGEYSLALSFYDSAFSAIPDAVDRIVIKVIESGISIVGVGTKNDPYIEIKNSSSGEISINNWIIKGDNHTFLIPEGMTILPNKSIKLSPEITGFDSTDFSSISILDKTGRVFALYPNTSKQVSHNYIIKENNNFYKTNNDTKENIIDLNNLPAGIKNSNITTNNKSLIYLGLVVVIIVGAISIIFVRRKNNYEDYIEKEIRAEDIKIIE